MDQEKIGSFLKQLRKEKNISQEQLAEKFFVSVRTVSRWENGNTMPDISILIKLADFYNVDMRELLKGERKSDNMNEDLKETLEMVADYTAAEKEKLTKELKTMVTCMIFLFLILGAILSFHLYRISPYFSTAAIFCASLGTVYSIFSAIKIRQLTGKMGKKSFKKLAIALTILGGFVAVLSVLAIMFACGVFG